MFRAYAPEHLIRKYASRIAATIRKYVHRLYILICTDPYADVRIDVVSPVGNVNEFVSHALSELRYYRSALLPTQKMVILFQVFRHTLFFLCIV